MTAPKRSRSGPSGKSGDNLREGVLVREIRDGQLDEWREAAEVAGLGFSAWAREALDAAATNPCQKRRPRRVERT